MSESGRERDVEWNVVELVRQETEGVWCVGELVLSTHNTALVLYCRPTHTHLDPPN